MRVEEEREREERERQEQEERERQERQESEEETVGEKQEEETAAAAHPKRGLVSNLKIRYLEHQRDQLTKAISKTHKKEVAIDAGDDSPEMKEIRTWRQQGKRRKLLKKQQKMEEKIKRKREKQRKRKDQEEAEEDDEKKAGLFLRIVTGFFEGYGDLNMAVL
ncbi:trichohyalin-like protein [Lates japonicus]|uniref:Trichohyalin-like protein n=1 Tax=Lates japonicus TaxID=270547 RepID=A0AAD3RCT1_LATJO|nr:trichohyalin-like protein [Lates japonicus]